MQIRSFLKNIFNAPQVNNLKQKSSSPTVSFEHPQDELVLEQYNKKREDLVGKELDAGEYTKQNVKQTCERILNTIKISQDGCLSSENALLPSRRMPGITGYGSSYSRLNVERDEDGNIRTIVNLQDTYNDYIEIADFENKTLITLSDRGCDSDDYDFVIDSGVRTAYSEDGITKLGIDSVQQLKMRTPDKNANTFKGFIMKNLEQIFTPSM